MTGPRYHRGRRHDSVSLSRSEAAELLCLHIVLCGLQCMLVVAKGVAGVQKPLAGRRALEKLSHEKRESVLDFERSQRMAP